MDLFRDLALISAVGLSFQSVTWLVPLRKQSGAKETYWDATAMICCVVFAHIYTFLIAVPLSGALGALEPVKQWRGWVGTWPLPVTYALYLVFADFLVYWSHRWLHSRLLWNIHAWHHSPTHLWWLSGMRASPLHVAILMLPYTISYLVLPLDATGIVLFAIILFDIVNQHWLHSNIKLPFARQLELLFVTPRFHFIHHSADARFNNSNYGFIFTVWDRLFGTYTHPELVTTDEQLGLNYQNSKVRLLIGLPPPKGASLHQEMPLGREPARYCRVGE